MHGNNSIGVSPTSQSSGDHLACMDRLPIELRRALHDGVVNWDPQLMRRLLNQGYPVRNLVEMIADWNNEEVTEFQYVWPSRFGRYPAVAAAATIMSYNEAEKVRNARR